MGLKVMQPNEPFIHRERKQSSTDPANQPVYDDLVGGDESFLYHLNPEVISSAALLRVEN